MTTTYELYTNENGTPKAVEGKAPAIIERVEALEEKSDDYLPSSGGKMTGNVQYYRNGIHVGGIYTYADGVNMSFDMKAVGGARLVLRPRESPDYPKTFSLVANGDDWTGVLDGDEKKLRWNGVEVSVPVGTVIAFASNAGVYGYLLCNGGAVSRATYADLFARIGTTYGSGDGSTTFNLPNLTDRFIQGSGTVGAVKSAGLPNIKGLVGNLAYAGSGAFTNRTDSGNGWGPGDMVANNRAYFDASLSNSIYGNSNTVQPPALTMRYYIKY